MKPSFPTAAVMAAFFYLPAAAPAVEPGPTYTVESLQGSAFLLPAGAEKEVAAQVGDELFPGDRIRVGEKGLAVLMAEDLAALELGAGGSLTVEGHGAFEGGFRSRLKLWAGSVLARVRSLAGSRSEFEIEAGGVVTGVRGTVFEVAYAGEEEVTAAVFEGEVEVRGERVRRLREGRLLKFHKRKLRLERHLDRREKERFKRWLERYEKVHEKRRERLERLKKRLKAKQALDKRRETLRRLRDRGGR